MYIDHNDMKPATFQHYIHLIKTLKPDLVLYTLQTQIITLVCTQTQIITLVCTQTQIVTLVYT